jgi:hypothetical protein
MVAAFIGNDPSMAVFAQEAILAKTQVEDVLRNIQGGLLFQFTPIQSGGKPRALHEWAAQLRTSG